MIPPENAVPWPLAMGMGVLVVLVVVAGRILDRWVERRFPRRGDPESYRDRGLL